MKVWYKEPGRAPEMREVENDLDTLQGLVGGYIECVFISKKLALVCNEEGKLKGLEPNLVLQSGDVVHGSVFVAGVDGEDFGDVPYTREEISTLFMFCI